VDRQGLRAVDRALAVDRVAEHVEHATEGDLADRDGDRLAGIEGIDPASEAVGRGHRHRPDPVVAEMLLDLADEVVLSLALDRDGVVDRRQAAGREFDVDDGTGDLDDLAGRGRCGARHGGTASWFDGSRQCAWAPEAISIISRVMLDWRTLL
jgi:hypothetical protein